LRVPGAVAIVERVGARHVHVSVAGDLLRLHRIRSENGDGLAPELVKAEPRPVDSKPLGRAGRKKCWLMSRSSRLSPNFVMTLKTNRSGSPAHRWRRACAIAAHRDVAARVG